MTGQQVNAHRRTPVTYLPVHSSSGERADDGLCPLQTLLPTGFITCLLLLGLLKAILPIGLISLPLQLSGDGTGLLIRSIGCLLLLCLLAVALPDDLILLQVCRPQDCV